MKINFRYDIEKFRLRDSKLLKRIISRIVSDAGLKGGSAVVVITSDEKVYEINREFLGHDYFTDIITFNYNRGKSVNGEIYISAQRVKENSEKFGVTLNSEIRRVIFHGFLHLCGYDDRTAEEKKKMSEMEEMYLALSYAE
ncbi:MAG: rRNA maturation RNase YbeY [Bacteroidales bacterium]|nr:rRNA maturation RNase YbeY [Bacteroidales bacterium]